MFKGNVHTKHVLSNTKQSSLNRSYFWHCCNSMLLSLHIKEAHYSKYCTKLVVKCNILPYPRSANIYVGQNQRRIKTNATLNNLILLLTIAFGHTSKDKSLLA